MANISPLNYPYFTNNVTQLNAENLNPIVEKINQLVQAVNSGTIVTPEVPTILFDTSNETVALTATEGLAILYSTNGSSTPETPYDAALSVARGVNLTTRTTNGLEYSEVPKISVKYNKVSGTIEFIASESGTIRYTTNGNDPTSSSPSYSGAINPVSGTTYKVAVFSDSAKVTDISTIQV
jgi:hypothetical protein